MTATSDSPALKIVVVVLAVIGAVALLGVGGMALMHVTMMDGIGFGGMRSMMAGMRC